MNQNRPPFQLCIPEFGLTVRVLWDSFIEVVWRGMIVTFHPQILVTVAAMIFLAVLFVMRGSVTDALPGATVLGRYDVPSPPEDPAPGVWGSITGPYASLKGDFGPDHPGEMPFGLNADESEEDRFAVWERVGSLSSTQTTGHSAAKGERELTRVGLDSPIVLCAHGSENWPSVGGTCSSVQLLEGRNEGFQGYLLKPPPGCH